MASRTGALDVVFYGQSQLRRHIEDFHNDVYNSIWNSFLWKHLLDKSGEIQFLDCARVG